MNLAQLMTSPVITVSPDSPLPALLELMERHRVSAVVLAEADGRLAGIVTERDITRSAAEDRLYAGQTGRSLAVGQPVTAEPKTDWREAFQLMVLSRVRHLVVIDSAGKPVGIVTETNFLHSLGLEYFVDLSTIKEVVARDVVALKPTDSVHAALELMHRHCVSCIPITDAGRRPVGILTERDVIRLSLQRLDFYHTRLQEVMSRPVCAVSEQTVLPDVVEILKLQKIRRLVIVDGAGRLTGLLTETDLLKGLQSRYSRLLREIISEQERQLRETRKLLNEQTILHNLLESAPDTGIAATDMNLRIRYFNPVAARIYGYPPEEVIGRTVHEFHVLHQIAPERLDSALRIIRDRGFYEYSIQRQTDKGTRYYELRVSAVRNPANEMVGYMLLAQDVTRRKKAEAALQRSEERLRKSQQFARVGSWDWQLAADELHWSDQMPVLFGQPAGKKRLPRSQFLQAVHPDDREGLIEAVRTCIEQNAAYEIEYRVVWPDGSVHWLHEQGDVVRDEDGSPLNMLGVAQDVTRRKEAELQVQAQNRFLDSVIENIPSLLFVKEAKELRYVRFNRAGEQLTGQPASDFLGKSDADLLNADQAAAAMAADRRLLDSGRGAVEVSEQELATSHQGSRLLRIRKVPLPDEQGRPAYLLGIADDITEQRAAEQNLAEARMQAEKANQAKSDFLANMSHEIRTPMNGIIGLTELALNTHLDAQQADYLHKVSQSAHSLLGLLNDILDFSKIEAHRLELECIPFDLRDLLAQIESLMAIQSRQKNIPLRIQIDPEIPQYLLGDPLRIKQILLNLVGNAFKFTKRGEVSIQVRPGLHAQSGYLPIAFTVQDTGIGISKEQQAMLFEAFVQSDSSTTRIHGGTGLGLAITKQLVELMDGTIELTSEPGKGSTFAFTLPLRLSDEDRLAEHIERLQTQGPDFAVLEQIRGAAILLVEDNAINQQVAMELLAQEDFQVDLAENGREALEMLRPGRYDLVLLDIQMPIMDGYQAVAAIRAQEVYKKLPVLAMSANAMSHDREKCLAAGMNDHLPKPVDRRQLLAALCRWIKPNRRKRRRQPLRRLPQQSVSLPHLPGINVKAALGRLGGNASLYLSLLRNFAHDHPQAVQDIRGQLAQPGQGSAERLAHSLKGIAGAIGADALQEISGLLEDGIRKQLPLAGLLNETEKQLGRVIAALHVLPPPQEEAKPAQAAVDQEEISSLLRLLEQRLRSYDAGTIDTLNSLLDRAQEPALRSLLLEAKRPIEQFDFAAATELLAGWPPPVRQQGN